ncbi:hypothetical protein A4G28_10470 [Mycobacterium ostraviense]|uniref:Antitoxin Xre/MbcA/ParS-like toxin-binding domain-containing protein n=2 Tax=Mycobacterium ostraviense TaxID=2738409 RepID=A0A163VX74_9MYCO|nr:hypothetical protein A4G28_10470 [Mycobacterium ostraviense]
MSCQSSPAFLINLRCISTPEGRAARARGEKHLRAAFQMFELIQTVDAPQTVRAWFMGMNLQKEDVSPAEALAEGSYCEVTAAARAFVSGG